MAFVFSILAFFLLLGIVVVVHELGHLLIARANGVFCETFSFGFGPVLYSRKDRSGTDWRISLYPIGGYVKMFGDADASSVKEVIPQGYTEEDMQRMSAHRKKPWQRLLISAGGPLANIVFSIFLMFMVSVINGIPTPDNSISVVSEECLAFKSGLKTGDKIVKANGKDINTFIELASEVKSSIGKDLQLHVKHSDDAAPNQITVRMYGQDESGKIVPIETLGIKSFGITYTKAPWYLCLANSARATYRLAVDNLSAMFKIATSKMSAKNVGGIVSIFKMSSQSVQSGFVSFIMMIAMISTVLGAINLLPIPVLDGGAIVISTIEWIIGKPLNEKFINAIFMLGLLVVIGLMLLGIWNDLSNCKFFNWVESLFR